MNGRRLAIYGFTLLAAGCTAPAPKPNVVATPPPVVQAPPPSNPEVAPQLVALIEPYMVVAEPEKVYMQPPALGGRIRMADPMPETAPLIAPPPAEVRPVPTPPKTATVTPPKAQPVKPVTPPRGVSSGAVSTMVRLLEEERARSVEVAKGRLAAATARANQTSSDAKTTADLVRSGALAQVKADQAAAAAKEAASEQVEAQKALDAAQQRQREARRDVEAALKGVAEATPGMTLAAEKVKVPVYQPLPYTYRLSILGDRLPGVVKLERGTLGRSVPTISGEAGAWIVRCADPSQLHVKVGEQAASVMVRKLPSAVPEKPRV